MYRINLALILAIFYLGVAQAELFVVQPLEGSTCQANKPCTITWVDNGVRPLLSAVGVSTVGLYMGRQQLVQTIDPVDVSTQHSVTFKPNPSAGANYDKYYIAITSTTLKGNDSIPYSGWSSFFTITGMSGSFDAPLASATSSIPIPTTLSTSNGVGTSTRTVGAVSTSTTATSTRMITSSRPASIGTPRSSFASSQSSSQSSSATSSKSTPSVSTTISAALSPPTVSTSASSTGPASISTSATSTAPVVTGTSAAAVTTPAASSASTGSASRVMLVLIVAGSIIYSIV